MKKTVCTLLILGCVLSSRLFSLDLELVGGLGNLAFDKDRTTALSDTNAAGAFSPQLFPLALARLSGDYRGLAWTVGFQRDPLERNRLFGNLRADLGYFFLEAGPVIGVFNSSKFPLNPGISAALGLSIPGIIFVQASGSSTLGAVMDITGSYFQNTGDISTGFWVPHVVCSLNLDAKNYSSREEANLLVTDGLIRYFFRADVYTKNVPYTLQLDLGFQKLSRSYSTQKIDSNNDFVKDTETDEFKSVFVGLEGTYTFNSAFKFLLGAEMPVYSWGVRPMKDPPKSAFLFEAHAGIVWTLGGN